MGYLTFMTTNETKTETKRVSKVDELNAALENAKAALASAQATLQPQIDAEQDKVNVLRVAYVKADKESSRAYNDYKAVQQAAEARLFPADASKRLLEAIKAKVGEQFPHANFVSLAHQYQGHAIAADADVVKAGTIWRESEKAREKAQRAYNVAQAPDSTLSRLKTKLDGFKERVAKLEKEIERVPSRNSAARDRRAAEKQEALEAEQTKAARALLAADGFSWEVSK